MNIIGLSGSLSAPSRTRALVAAVLGEISRQTGHGGPLRGLRQIEGVGVGRAAGGSRWWWAWPVRQCRFSDSWSATSAVRSFLLD